MILKKPVPGDRLEGFAGAGNTEGEFGAASLVEPIHAQVVKARRRCDGRTGKGSRQRDGRYDKGVRGGLAIGLGHHLRCGEVKRGWTDTREVLQLEFAKPVGAQAHLVGIPTAGKQFLRKRRAVIGVMSFGSHERELSVEAALAQALAGLQARKGRANDQHVSWQL